MPLTLDWLSHVLQYDILFNITMKTIPSPATKTQRATYADLGDACATAHAMELIGARWTYPILRELMLGPKRFNELMASVRGITPAVLTARLHELADSGLAEPVPEPSTGSYQLTPWALELAPILRELGRWAQSSPHRSTTGGLTPDAVVQAMITMAADVAPRRPLHVHLHLFDARTRRQAASDYCVCWDADEFHAQRARCEEVATTVHGDSSTWGRVLFADLALADSGIEIEGPELEARDLIGAFRLR